MRVASPARVRYNDAAFLSSIPTITPKGLGSPYHTLAVREVPVNSPHERLRAPILSLALVATWLLAAPAAAQPADADSTESSAESSTTDTETGARGGASATGDDAGVASDVEEETDVAEEADEEETAERDAAGAGDGDAVMSGEKPVDDDGGVEDENEDDDDDEVTPEPALGTGDEEVDVGPQEEGDEIEPTSKTSATEGAIAAAEAANADLIVPMATGSAMRDVGVLRNLRRLQERRAAGEEGIPDREHWAIFFGGYLRSQFVSVQDDPEIPLVGRNDGFIVGNARPVFIGLLSVGLGFRIQLEAAAGLDRPQSTNVTDNVVTRLRDAYIFYAPLHFLELQVGQFKPPHDLEALLSTRQIMFVDRSVGSKGVLEFEGRRQRGLSADRHAGIQLTGRPIYFNAEDMRVPRGLGLSYGLAVTNGSDASLSLNDNDRLAYYGRLALHWADIVQIGGGAYLNERLLGDPPDQAAVTRTGFTADASVQVAGVTAIASVMSRTEDPDIDAEAAINSLAYQAQIGYRAEWAWGLQLAYRYAFYDPSNSFPEEEGVPEDPIFTNDALTGHTIGLNWLPGNLPFRMMLNYTIAGEQPERQITNNRFDAMVQVDW